MWSFFGYFWIYFVSKIDQKISLINFYKILTISNMIGVHKMKNLLLTFLMISTSLLSQTMHTINAGNFYYSPEAMTIEQGDSVEFINDNGFHDVVITSGPEILTLPACSGPCDIGVLVFNTPGEYEYICSIGSHSSLGMVGTIVVNETDEIFQPQTNNELQTAVDLWVSDNATALATYGEINTWDVSLITDMSHLFDGKQEFNSDISALIRFFSAKKISKFLSLSCLPEGNFIFIGLILFPLKITS